MKDITYLLDAEVEFKRLALYKINHTDKAFYKMYFDYIKEVEDYILKNNCFPLYFYGYGYLASTYNKFKKLNYNISQDFEIYEWWIQLPNEIRRITNVGYYYQMHGYELKKNNIKWRLSY